MENKVKIENVSKVFNTTSNKKKLWKLIFPFLNKENDYFYALKNISFEVQPGDSVGIVGLNGSGKSTLSNLLGGVTSPSSGEIIIDGKPSLIAISAGLNNELTGEENIHMKCLMHGLSQSEIDEKYDDIVRFSELEEFLKQPIKNYSSGMRARLGFAIAVHTDPDVLIVDEALSVGDSTFTNKCLNKMKSFQEEGKTIFFVSHSAPEIRNMCNKAAWIHFGELRDFGNGRRVVNEYSKFIQRYNEKSKDEQHEYKKSKIEGQRSSTVPVEKDNTRFGISSSLIVGIFTIVVIAMGYLQTIMHF